MRLKNKNQTFQSCRFCCEGNSLYLVEDEDKNERFYVCEKHREKEEVKNLLSEGVEEEYLESTLQAKAGIIQRAINYIKGS